jgi:N-acetyl-S-(2-succino)cysteine monooxygenase
MPEMQTQMILATFIHNSGSHPGGWRYPANGPVDQHDFTHYARLAKKAEQGKLHVYFSGDSQGYPNIKGKDAFAATDYAGKLEPTTLLAALAAITQNIGLVATVSTTFNEPYAVARRFASLDHISKGRVGWNVVTSTGNIEARNFGFDKIMDHDRRYERAEEFVDVVRKLWDSWEDGAIQPDAISGRYFNPEKVHQLNHDGEFFRVAGPLNVGRPPQGHPVIVQAGGSPSGRALAARTADMIFTAQNNLEDAQAFYSDMKSRASGYGRDPSTLKVIPSVQFILGGSEAEAEQKKSDLLTLVPEALALQTLQSQIGADLSNCDLDGPLPEISKTEGGQWVQDQIVKMAGEENLTVRELAKRVVVSRASLVRSGTPEQIADFCESWFKQGAADGFSVTPNYLPENLNEFVDEVVPILQSRGLFRKEYEEGTLRENLGLARPANSFVEDPECGVEPEIWQ